MDYFTERALRNRRRRPASAFPKHHQGLPDYMLLVGEHFGPTTPRKQTQRRINPMGQLLEIQEFKCADCPPCPTARVRGQATSVTPSIKAAIRVISCTGFGVSRNATSEDPCSGEVPPTRGPGWSRPLGRTRIPPPPHRPRARSSTPIQRLIRRTHLAPLTVGVLGVLVDGRCPYATTKRVLVKPAHPAFEQQARREASRAPRASRPARLPPQQGSSAGERWHCGLSHRSRSRPGRSSGLPPEPTRSPPHPGMTRVTYRLNNAARASMRSS